MGDIVFNRSKKLHHIIVTVEFFASEILG